MVRSLAGQIEAYLKQLLHTQDYIELQRSELAEIFRCVPSQINYVLGTRFTPAQGYIVESRRGGGGYLRIVKLSWEEMQDAGADQLTEMIGEAISQNQALGIIERLLDEGCITKREYHLLRMITSREILSIAGEEEDTLRARILQSALTAFCRLDAQNSCSSYDE